MAEIQRTQAAERPNQHPYILIGCITFMAVNNSAFLTTVIAICACIGLMVVLVYQKNREIEALKSDLDTLTKEYNALAEKYNSGVRSPDAT